MRWTMMKMMMMMMMLVVLNFGGTQSDRNVSSECNQNVALPCSQTASQTGSGTSSRTTTSSETSSGTGSETSSVEMFSITWVKVDSDGKKKRSIIRKSKSRIDRYDQRGAELGDEHSLLLSAVTPDDSGTYECVLKATAGGQNVQGSVWLRVKDCATTDHTTLNRTLPSEDQDQDQDQDQVLDLPLSWSIFIFVCVAVGKIIPAVICIWVVHQRSTRKKQKKKKEQSCRRHH